MLLDLNRITVSYPGAEPVFENFDLSIGRGEFVSITGNAGCGKTTLLETIGGFHKPQSGKVLFDGEDIYAGKFDQINFRRKLQIVFQFPENQFFETNVLEEIAFGPKMLNIPEAERENKINDALRSVGLDGSICSKSPYSLSGGQKRLLALACAFVTSPDVLLLDEPFSGLDAENRQQQIRILRDKHKKGTTILMVSHDPETICETSDRMIVLGSGKILMDGTPENVYSLSDPHLLNMIGQPDSKKTADLLGIKNLPDLRYDTFISELEKKILRRDC